MTKTEIEINTIRATAVYLDGACNRGEMDLEVYFAKYAELTAYAKRGGFPTWSLTRLGCAAR